MSEQKTQPTAVPVEAYIAELPDARRRAEAEDLVELMTEVTGEEAVMWGPSIIGFGTRHYTYVTGREGDWPRAAFSPRRAAISFYGLQEDPDAAALLKDLGPHTATKGCVYVKRLETVDLGILKQLVRATYDLGDYELGEYVT